MSNPRIREVVNEPLTAVAFVHDYVEFHFDGKVIRAFGGPTVERKGKAIGADEAGWRDALCELIGAEVRDLVFVSVAPQRLRVCFANETDLVVPLVASKRTGPEVLHYVPGDNEPIEVW